MQALTKAMNEDMSAGIRCSWPTMQESAKERLKVELEEERKALEQNSISEGSSEGSTSDGSSSDESSNAGSSGDGSSEPEKKKPKKKAKKKIFTEGDQEYWDAVLPQVPYPSKWWAGESFKKGAKQAVIKDTIWRGVKEGVGTYESEGSGSKSTPELTAKAEFKYSDVSPAE